MSNIKVSSLSSKDIQNNDTAGYDKFKDLTVPANSPVRVGEWTVPAGTQLAGWGGDKLFFILYDTATTQVRIDGNIHFGVQGPSGATQYSHHISTFLAGATGQGSVPSEWYKMPMAETNKCTVGGGKLIIDFEATTTTATDSTDHLIYSLPYFLVT